MKAQSVGIFGLSNETTVPIIVLPCIQLENNRELQRLELTARFYIPVTRKIS
jgi:hypothetical protein